MNRRQFRRRQRRKRFALCVVVFLAIMGFVTTYALHEKQFPQVNPPATISQAYVIQESPSATPNYLILVNSEHPISEYQLNFDIVSAYGMLPLAESDIMLEQNTRDALILLFDAADQEGVYNLVVSSGYRSQELQRQIYNETKDKDYVQLPGYSEHQTGLAVDIAINYEFGISMEDSWEAQWLTENAWKYGFILRYPQGKESITGIAFEPWHFRYVGIENARKIYESGLCLEEYLAYQTYQ